MFGLTRRKPLFPDVSNFEREVDPFFRSFWNRPSEFWDRSDAMTSPRLNVYEQDGNLVVEADVPGLKKEDLRIEMHGDHLTLRGETKHEQEKKDRNYYAKEVRYGSFERTVALPYEIAADNAKAEMKDGVLRVVLPKSEAAKKIGTRHRSKGRLTASRAVRGARLLLPPV
jgi:HSP20 family protein